LALFFITLANFYAIKYYFQGKSKFIYLKIFGSYLCSILCQPITILWPIAAAIIYLINNKSEHRKEFMVSLLPFFLTMITFIGLNYYYYDQVYPLQTAAKKMGRFHPAPLATMIFTFSRSFIQLFLPIKFSMAYSSQSFLNLLGLPLFALFIWVLKTRSNLKTVFCSLLVLLFPLIIVYSRPTNIFITDTYIIHSLFGFVLLLGLFLSSFKKRFKPILIVVIIFLSLKTSNEVFIVSNSSKVFEVSYKREPTCKTILFYANELIKEAEIKKFKKVSEVALANKCIVRGSNADALTSRLFVLSLYLNERVKNKAELLKDLNQNDFLIGFLTRLAYAKKKVDFEQLKLEIEKYDLKNNYYVNFMKVLLKERKATLFGP
jgi:hypothetical protein